MGWGIFWCGVCVGCVCFEWWREIKAKTALFFFVY